MKKKGFKFDEIVMNMAAFSDYTLHIIFTDDVIQAEDYICTRDNLERCTPSSDAHALHIRKTDDWVSYVIFPRDATAGTLAHECWHVIYSMLDKMGAVTENEIVAYLLGYIVNKAEEFQIKLRRAKNDPRRKRTIAGSGRNRRGRGHNKPAGQAAGGNGTPKVRGAGASTVRPVA